MTQKQQNRLSMYKAVADHLNAHQSLWQKFAPFSAAAGALRQAIANLDKALQQQAVANSTGATADKASLVQVAVKRVSALARNAAVYAITANNIELYAQLDYPRSYLERLPDNEQVAMLQAMLGKVQEHAASLGDYMVTKKGIADAQTAIDAAATALVRPRTVIDAHSTATANIPALLTEGRYQLDLMDKLIHNFADDAPDFVTNYRQARIVVDSGIRHEDTAADAAGDEPAGE